MGPFVVKWTHDPSLRGLLERKRGSGQVLIVFVTVTVSSIVFSLFNPGAGHSGNRDLCCDTPLCDRRDYALPNVWKEFLRTVKWFYLFLIFSIWPSCSLPVITDGSQRYCILQGLLVICWSLSEVKA